MEEEQKRIDIISFMAPINDHTISHLIDLTHTAQNEGSSELHLHISSTGGRLYPAFTAYNFLRTLRLPFHTHNIGSIEATALMLYLASDHRSAAPNSKFVLDNLEWTFPTVHARFAEVAEAYNHLSFDAACYSRIFAERAGTGYDIAGRLSGQIEVLTPEAAKEAGIVSADIATPSVPELARVWLVRN